MASILSDTFNPEIKPFIIKGIFGKASYKMILFDILNPILYNINIILNQIRISF